MDDSIIKFIRQKDFKFIKDLGQGACGKTVLLYDDIISEYFVCKKYLPCDESLRPILFINFLKEIKNLHKINHNNIVGIYNYYLYHEHHSGYILMEYIDGTDIENYARKNPEQVNELFTQLIDAFKHLESNNILHRDIRPQNILVSTDNVVKVIDLGFSKKVTQTIDFDKSISLNWWCDLPHDFMSNTYDFRTEVYFIGKLISGIINDASIEHFKYNEVLTSMCAPHPNNRIQSFFEVSNRILSDTFIEIDFSEEEKHCYAMFSTSLHKQISKIDSSAKYEEDIDQIQIKLEDAYRSFMLESEVPDSALVTRCFINGPYRYYKSGMQVSTVKDFIKLLKTTPPEKKNIIIANIFSKLNAITRYEDKQFADVPF